MATRDPLYSDLDLALTRNPITGDCAAVSNESAVRRCILRVVKMRRFDVPFEPDKSAFIDEFLFDPVNVATAAAIQDRLSFALRKMESRASYKVDVTAGSSTSSGELQGYNISVHYKIKSLMVEGDISHFLERVR
jgi:hypothetical protein